MVLLTVLLFLLITVGLAIIVFLNMGSSVSLAVFGWHSPSLPIGLWILLAFFLGALLLYLVAVASAMNDRRELRKLRRRVADMEQAAPTNKVASMQNAAPIVPMVPMPGMPPPDISDLPTKH
jgi:uncharacterized integral membrane protein